MGLFTKVQKLSLDGTYEYVPTLLVPYGNGKKKKSNRDLPENKRIKVTIQSPKFAEREKYSYAKFTREVGEKNEYQMFFDYEAAMINCVPVIKGLEEEGITSGATLYSEQQAFYEAWPLVVELFNEICRPFLSEDEESKRGITAGE